MTSAELTDALRGCAGGDRNALRRILNAEGGRMLGIAQRMLHRRDLAEEAVQDAMVRIWQKAHQFHAGDGSAHGWIFAILRNRCRNILRDSARLSTFAPEDLTAMQDARLGAATHAAAGLEEGLALHACLSRLDPAAARAIVLAHVGGFNHDEISDALSVPLGTCKSWIRRGLDTLRRCLS
ncbi:sigma-70 family RNA polymerase sigma factor [Falsirhodobacter sp. 20TX0035]|uniref:sigma-70 family RNA polymerase sigma factor n=1 Tax=Falsirhodobacter sp. 20TX0035 TaxID=3022019 RepID=UPI00232FD689|nr:sigma-70 family RNA polymerase sigma factor [Falsirhodobacter sp. 20TX0035]MDB6453711.1 sigma-70 family RNA polymerase sigma factor [Falsirhodobacter sp. 20TX0035]